MHVVDASRVVGVVSTCSTPTGARSSTATTATTRSDSGSSTPREGAAAAPLPDRDRTPDADRLAREDLAEPAFQGVRTVEPELAELRDYIDWTFFFSAWELKGRYPQILDHPRHGEAARELFEAANELLDTIVAEGSLRARGVYGFWRAWSEGDDVVLEDGTRFPMLRQQSDHGGDRPSRSLADFVAPSKRT